MGIENIDISKSLEKSYLDYSMSVIVGRALPDVRDGLKPVHRRILYSMNELNLSPKSPYKKSARIVGDVIGKYHPHGDSAVYDALVRMAQSFSMRIPIVDGQGNFGSIDGDNPAAMRYTEARMTSYAEELLRDIEKDTINFIPNYDNSLEEPEVLPTRVPNLLINGSNGIAVGMATNIPPHRIDEVIDASLLLLENPNSSVEELLDIVKGPDFPTGGIIYGKSGIFEAYRKGRGRIKVRAKLHYEKVNSRDAIVIDELPYQVNKARLLEQIANLVRSKSIDGISDIRDESDRKGIRVVIELKKGAIKEVVEKNLLKSTNLEITFSINLLAIKNYEPKLFNLVDILQEFISHRKEVITRRTTFELEKAKAKAHILEGVQVAISHIDEVVQIIKSSPNSSEAKEILSSKFELSQKQTSAILDMRLQKLTSFEIDRLLQELEELKKEIEYLQSILDSEEKLKDVIRKELLEIKSKYSSPRKTAIEEDYDDIDVEDLIPNLPMVVTITNNGYIKRVPLSTYEKQKRGGKGKTAITTYEDDFVKDFFISNAHDTLLIITNFGQLFWLKVYKIPEASRQAKGKAIVNLIQLRDGENIRAVIPTDSLDDTKSLLFFTKHGLVKRTNLAHFSNIRSLGVKAIKLDEEDELVTAKIADSESEHIAIFTTFGKVIRFSIDEVREMGRNTRGVVGIKFGEKDDYVVDGIVLKSEDGEILTVSENGLGKRTKISEYRVTKRGGKGIISMKLTNRTGKRVIGAVEVESDRDLMVLTETGKIIRISFDEVAITSRNTSGVILVKGDKVVSISTSPKDEIDN
ncbi:MAG TPA: DNA gyrase subunit A [Campylobacterales bacterium]|nr:DNA gyrase subunit A [Campylobacterales bacterium]